MPRSIDQAARGDAGRRLAIIAASLYLANLLILPGIAFLILLWFVRRVSGDESALATAHLSQALRASLWVGVLLVPAILAALVLAALGWLEIEAGVLVILYFIICHTSFVLLGIVALTKAMAGNCWRYPLIGPRLPQGCAQARRNG